MEYHSTIFHIPPPGTDGPAALDSEGFPITMLSTTHESDDDGAHDEPTPLASASYDDNDPAPPVAPPPLLASGEAGSDEGPESMLPGEAAYIYNAFEQDLRHGIEALGLSVREAFQRACVNLRADQGGTPSPLQHMGAELPQILDRHWPTAPPNTTHGADGTGAHGAPAPPADAGHGAEATDNRRSPASAASAKRPRSTPADDEPDERQHACPDMDGATAPQHTPVIPIDTDAGTCTTPGCPRRSLFPHGTCCPRCPGQFGVAWGRPCHSPGCDNEHAALALPLASQPPSPPPTPTPIPTPTHPQPQPAPPPQPARPHETTPSPPRSPLQQPGAPRRSPTARRPQLPAASRRCTPPPHRPGRRWMAHEPHTTDHPGTAHSAAPCRCRSPPRTW